MKKIIFAIALIVLIATQAEAGQKYNAHSGQWETVPDSWQTKYNAHTNEWSYQPQNARTEYNAHEGTWDWNSGHGNRRKKSGYQPLNNLGTWLGN